MLQKISKRFLVPPLVGVIIVMAYLLIVGSALKNPTPKHVPLAVVGPPPMAQNISMTLQTKMPHAFTVIRYDSLPNAESDLRRGKLDGVLQPQSNAIVVTASATGEVTTAAVNQVAQALASAQHIGVESVDITPQAEGLGTAIVTMFLLLLTTVAAILTQALINGRKAKPTLPVWFSATALTAACIGTGATAAAAILGEYRSIFLQVDGCLVTLALISASLSALLTELAGELGLSLSALLLIPFGVATAGVLFDYRFLPGFYEVIARYSPAANMVALIHQVNYFNSVNVLRPLLVLAIWLAATAGALVTIRLYRQRQKVG